MISIYVKSPSLSSGQIFAGIFCDPTCLRTYKSILHRERCGCVLKNQIVSPTSTLSQKTIDVTRRIPHCPDNNLNLGIIKPEPLMAGACTSPGFNAGDSHFVMWKYFVFNIADNVCFLKFIHSVKTSQAIFQNVIVPSRCRMTCVTYCIYCTALCIY